MLGIIYEESNCEFKATNVSKTNKRDKLCYEPVGTYQRMTLWDADRWDGQDEARMKQALTYAELVHNVFSGYFLQIQIDVSG